MLGSQGLLDHLDRWKATELRQFLLYTGPVVLKGIKGNIHLYLQFLLFLTVLSILLDEGDHRRSTYISLIMFISTFSVLLTKLAIFMEKLATYNIHPHKHHEDMEHSQMSLNSISAFKYENYLQKLKKLIRGSGNASTSSCMYQLKPGHNDLFKITLLIRLLSID